MGAKHVFKKTLNQYETRSMLDAAGKDKTLQAKEFP